MLIMLLIVLAGIIAICAIGFCTYTILHNVAELVKAQEIEEAVALERKRIIIENACR